METKGKQLMMLLTSVVSYQSFEIQFWGNKNNYAGLSEYLKYSGDYNNRTDVLPWTYYSVNRFRDVLFHCHTKS